MTLDELKKLAGVDIVRHDNVQSLENMSHTAQALKDTTQQGAADIMFLAIKSSAISSPAGGREATGSSH